MRRFTIAIAIALILVGCSSVDRVVGTTTTLSAASEAVPAELVDHEIREVTVGDRSLTLAVADSPQLRAQGLMGVTGLGNLDGMLFYWRHEAGSDFWMKDTLIPLDIVWFLEDGSFAGRASMEPCETDVCPTYSPGGGIDFRFAIEAERGELDWVTADKVIVYSD